MSDTIGQKIKEIRCSRRLKQGEFAEKIGIRQGYLSEIESGKKIPSSSVILSLKRSFPEISLDDLAVDGESEKESYEKARKKALERDSKTVLNDLTLQNPPENMTQALGKAMVLAEEAILEGDYIILDTKRDPEPGDLVLHTRDGYQQLERWQPGDPKPYAICIRLSRNLR